MIVLSYVKQPTQIDIIDKLKHVLSGSLSREEFSIWAYRWVENFDNRNQLSSIENEVHSNLIFLLAIDLEIEPTVYFHGDEEIAEWIGEVKKGKPLS
ncbi:hypothetical protein B0H99_107110 [Planomicrobium soli]|uniref:Uncharacterized protein n=1 Tax=Planomicrobium soli TaxID=1176648 RepID=A0A2P8GQN4_9BACL|nr:hypothetical protein [Planomicrobium soli]PSL36289.1 hypothetical protein B0H99_107110 [Planomicrobium soli]